MGLFNLISTILLPISLNFPFAGVLSFCDLELVFLGYSELSLHPNDLSPQLIQINRFLLYCSILNISNVN